MAVCFNYGNNNFYNALFLNYELDSYIDECINFNTVNDEKT